MEQGFFKLSGEQLLFGANQVQHKDYLLIKEEHETYTYPIEGWYWFDTREEAETFFVSEGWTKPEEPQI